MASTIRETSQSRPGVNARLSAWQAYPSYFRGVANRSSRSRTRLSVNLRTLAKVAARTPRNCRQGLHPCAPRVGGMKPQIHGLCFRRKAERVGAGQQIEVGEGQLGANQIV